jgi:phosphopantothenoylcysteine decarboxylase/phosphopantothenate--cysteine ligase
MAEPEEIQQWLELYFEKDKELSGKKVLVTAGPTHEALDPVRFIGNASSGKMGIAIATELAARGAEVKLVIGPTAEKIPVFINTVHVVNAADMYEACVSEFEKTDWVIMSAAVADYTPVKTAKQKIKKADNLLAIELKKTVDILSHLGKIKKDSQCLVGFALETNDEKENAQAKLKNKNADMIVLNSLRDEGAGFGTDTNKITIFDKKGGTYEFETRPKSVVAADIVNAIIKYVNE